MIAVNTLAQKQTSYCVSVIVPFYNEEDVLLIFHRRLSAVLDSMPERCEIIYVNDGSSDSSQQLVESLNPGSSCITCINLSRNFGKESAMSAGLDLSRGLAVIVIDADLQDPPEHIPSMVAHWREGFDIVNMKRKERHGESWFKRFSAATFYRVLNNLTNTHIPENVGDFRLLSRAVVDQIIQLKERNRYMKGLYTWPGFKQVTLSYDRDARFCGESKWSYLKLCGLAVDGITAFSIRPLRLATVAGIGVALTALGYGIFIVCKTLIFGESVSGYPSMMVVQLALGGVQLITIGVLGEYIGRIFIEAKQRPLYVVQSVRELKEEAALTMEKSA